MTKQVSKEQMQAFCKSTKEDVQYVINCTLLLTIERSCSLCDVLAMTSCCAFHASRTSRAGYVPLPLPFAVLYLPRLGLRVK